MSAVSTGSWLLPLRRLVAVYLVGWLCRTVHADYGVSYREPRLECLSDGIRLHIDPVGVFVGHVYVTGHFVGDKCHLNYCTQSTQQPFVMDVPYRGECNVRRHRSPQPMSVSYEVTVVIQHHPLFITAGDRAYRLNCVYRQVDSMLTQKITIKCVVESNLVPDVIYAVDLSSAHTTINAFRFADQIMVHFSCQITLCRKRDQGCEGISPPTCHPIEFPPIQAVYRQSSSSTNQPTVKVLTDNRYGIDSEADDRFYNRMSTRLPSTTNAPTTPAPPADYPTLVPAQSAPSPDQTTRDDKETYSSSQGAKEYGLEISNKEEEGSPRRVQGYRTETLSSVYDLPPGMALEPLPTPTPADVFFAANRRLRSKRNGVENITVEVEAKRILVLSSDESDHIDATTIERSEFVDTSQCGRVLVTQTLFLCAAALMQVTSVAVILVQRRIYHRNLRAAAMRPKSSNGY
ncbi:hypothetical protein Q1695_013274 [Nippostrongylus brasiliensis]|nr:hypothetical protein Q1695_013274 [Nippostrongylus brasiliensis]